MQPWLNEPCDEFQMVLRFQCPGAAGAAVALPGPGDHYSSQHETWPETPRNSPGSSLPGLYRVVPWHSLGSQRPKWQCRNLFWGPLI